MALMRSLVFLGSLIISMIIFCVITEATWVLTVFMSVCIAAIVCTVATQSGRVAGRRIMSNLTVGWGRRA